MMIVIRYLLLLLVTVELGFAQAPTQGLRAYYPFENCDALDVSDNNSDGIVFGEPTCECGVQGNALFLDGIDDYLAFAGNVESYFNQAAFTLSLYFRTADAIGTHDIISKRVGCDFNHVFAIRYTPSSRMISVELANSVDERTSFLEQLPAGLCWIHVAVVKDASAHSVYINGELIGTQSVDQLMDLTNTAALQVGNSPCIGSTDKRFRGFIDEIRIYRTALGAAEIRALYLGPDQIETRDTTIYQGGSALLKAGETCANQISWSPSAQVIDPNSFRTEVSPASTQTFTASYQYSGCTATDTVRVQVINPGDIECGELPMPNAFTPNGDGRNDRFFISNPFSLEMLESFEIFDRLGNKIFTTTKVDDSWDGTFKGTEVNPGLYLYKVKYTCQGNDLVKSGSVMVLR